MSETARQLALTLTRAMLAAIAGLRFLKVNYREILDAEEAAHDEGREFNASDAQPFIDQAQTAKDRL